MHLKIRGMLKIYEGCFVKREGSYFWLIFWCYCCANEFLPFWIFFIIHLSRGGKNENKKSIITKQEKEIASTMSFHIWKDSSCLSHQTLKVYARWYKKHFSFYFFPSRHKSVLQRNIERFFAIQQKCIEVHITQKPCCIQCTRWESPFS